MRELTLPINAVIGILAQTRGGAMVGVATGERLAIALDNAPNIDGRFTIAQIAEGLVEMGQPLNEAETVALKAVSAARGGK